MSEQINNNCPFCNSLARREANYETDSVYYKCPTCGEFLLEAHSFDELDRMRDEVAAFLYYNNNSRMQTKAEEGRYISFDADKMTVDMNDYSNMRRRVVSYDEVKAFYPKSFAERISKILLGFAERSGFFGNVVSLTRNELTSALFLKRFNNKNEVISGTAIQQQLSAITQYLKQNDYFDFGYLGSNVHVTLGAEGWKRVDDLQLNNQNNKNVFVSMAFNESTNGAREAIRAGIVSAGYSPEFIDEIIHNKQIVPEMFRLIRESRFLILEISDPNYGAYYEAGYALGLGKEVIITCSREVFNKEYKSDEEKKYAKYLKPHFDIAQKQILVWDDYGDLTKKLSEWIKSIIG